MTISIDTFVSVVCALCDDADIIEDYLSELCLMLDATFSDSEVLLVDRDSTDETHSLVEKLLGKLPRLRFIALSARVEEEVALAAGMENAIGDFVVTLRPATDPVHLVVDGVKLSMKGQDVITGVSTRSRGIFNSAMGGIFRILLGKLIGHRIPKNSTHFRVLSRRAVNGITRTGRYRHRFFVRVSHLGYKCGTLRYEPKSRGGRPLHEGTLEKIRISLGMVVFNSTRPLRFAAAMGLLGSGLAFSFAAYSVGIRLVKANVVEGWTTLMFVMSAIAFLQFLILAFLSEYVSRMLDEKSPGEDYDVAFEKHSSVMINPSKRNVLDDSVSQNQNRVQTGRDR